DNVTITNCNFKSGSDLQQPIDVTQSAIGGTIEYNAIDGDNMPVTDQQNALLTLFGTNATGTYTVEYNWFKNSYGIFIQGGGTEQSQIIQYNLFENNGSGTQSGDHADWIQDFSAQLMLNIDIGFNTILENQNN